MTAFHVVFLASSPTNILLGWVGQQDVFCCTSHELRLQTKNRAILTPGHFLLLLPFLFLYCKDPRPLAPPITSSLRLRQEPRLSHS